MRLHTLTLTGALDDLEFSLATAPGKGTLTLTVDLSRVSHPSPTTVAALLWIKRCATARGIAVAVRNASPDALHTLQHTGLLRLMAVEPPDAAR